MEADLQRFYGLDIRDRWHPDPARRLTLRRLAVLIMRFPPVEGNVVLLVTERPHWTLEATLLDDLRRTLAQVYGVKNPQPHPLRDTRRGPSKRMTPERARRMQAAKRRARSRRAAIDRGEIT